MKEDLILVSGMRVREHIEPLGNMDRFVVSMKKQVYLPITTVVFETRPEMMGRIQRIAEWHRKWFCFDREVIISDVDPNIEGMTWINCGQVPPRHMLRAWYSDMCVHGFNSLCQSQYLLVWQWDGFIINPQLWTEEFMKWDYIGAPHGDWWRRVAAVLKTHNPKWENPFSVPGQEWISGNGGFSLRSKKFLSICDGLSRGGPTSEDEDMFLCVEKRKEIEDKGAKFCPAILARKFSTDIEVMSRSFGFHSAYHLRDAKDYLERCYISNQ